MPPICGRLRIHYPKGVDLASPPLFSPLLSPPLIEEEATENAPDFRHVLEQFNRTMIAALQGRHNTEAFDIKRVKELGARDFLGSPDLDEDENWLKNLGRVFEVMRYPTMER